ncbi:Uncharacterised protein [Candidatus Bartonella washoeensis]|uniref:Uncharacterized protein n=1 Tax=Cardidatus Bartonella washoeensis 085-0475 TaxID=1094564 RepID=J0QNA4_9HYPH|nr:hypothetical protein MCW_01174 [Bartonella washoeensis 085-0475]SPU26834.1 Uncharacterised protein [Bartonella washoeensis]
MDIHYEIIRMFCMLIIISPIIATFFKILSGLSWKLSIMLALSSIIMFFISDFLRRYFGLV